MSTTGVGGTSQTTGTPGTTQPSLRATGTRDLGQDAFLRLLTTQLQNQDPTKPQDNGEFIAQLATFSQLEKLTTISAKLDQIGTALGVTLTDGADGGTEGSEAAGGTGRSSGTGGSGSSNTSSNSGTGSTGTSSTTNGGK